MPQAGTAWVDVRANLNGFNRQLNQEMSGRRMRRIGMLGGAALGAGVTVAATKAFSGTAGAAAQFETAFSEVRKTVDTDARGFARLERGIRRMARTIPISADELSGLAGQAGALGIRTRDLLRFTKTAAELGIATDLSSQDAANALARLSNVMGTSSRDFRRLGSTFVRLGNDGASTEREIADMALRIAGAGTQIGLTEAEVLSFASALASVGIEAEAGGSAISRVFIRLASASRQGGSELRTIARVAGVSAAEFRRAFEQDAATATLRFITGLDRVRRSGGDVFGTLDRLRLSEIRVRDALLRASAAGDLFNDQLRTGNAEWRRNNALTREANQRYETSAARYQRLRNQIRDFGITIGQRALPELNRLMDVLTDERLSGEEKFERISQEISRLVSTGLERAATIAVQSGPRIVGALVSGISQAWYQAGPLARLFTVAAILRAVGGPATVMRAGAAVGGHFGAGMVAGTTAAMAGAGAAGGAGVARGTALGVGAGYFAGGGAAGLAGRQLAGRRIHGPEWRYGAPVSQLGARGMAARASGMLSSLRTTLLPIAKRVGLAGVGIALADGVISEFGRHAALRGDDWFKALGDQARGGGFFQQFNIARRLPIVGGGFTPAWESAAKDLEPVMRRLLSTRSVLSQREIDDIASKAKQLRLTEGERRQIERIISLLRTGSRLRVAVSADMDERQLRKFDNNLRALRSGALNNTRDILRVSRRNMRLIGETWGEGTNAGRRYAARNMRAAADAITMQMARSGRVTRSGLALIERLFRNADLTDPSRRMARRFGREWADGMNTSARITRRGLARMLAEARQMPGPMRKIALETWLAQIEQAKRGRRITVEEFRQMRSKVLATFPGMKTESRSTARAIARSLVNMAEVGGSAIATLVSNANSGLTGFGARPIRFSLKRVKEQKRQRGGTITPVPGVGSGDKVPALLEPGEVVVNREAVRAMGGPERVNRINSLIPRFQTGGIVALGRQLQREGYQVGEHPAFGGVAPVHTTNSYHYRGMALDVNADGLPGGEAAWLDRLHARLRRMAGVVELLWRTTGHFDHLHVALGGGSGLLPGGAGGLGTFDLARLLLEGPDGPLKEVGQAAINRVHAAAKRFGQSRMGAEGREPAFGADAAVGSAGRFREPTRLLATYFTDPIGNRGNNLYDGGNYYAELGMGTRMGGLPDGTPLRVTYKGRSDVGTRGDVGTGAPGAQIDLHKVFADRIGFPFTKDWVTVQAAQLGGIIQRLASGGLVGRTRAIMPGGRGPRRGSVADLSTVQGNIREIARWARRPLNRRLRSQTVRYALRLIQGIGVPGRLQQQLTGLSTNADTWAEFASRAGALSYEMLYAERTQAFGPDGRPILDGSGRPTFHEPGDPILDAERRPMTHFAEVAGLTEAGWTDRRLGALVTLRNRLIEAAGIVRREQRRVARLIADVRARLRRLQAAIRRAGRERRRIERQREREERLLERERRRLRDAERELESATGSLRTARLSDVNRRNPRSVERRRQRIARYGRRVAALQEEIPRLRRSIDTRERRVGRLRGREAEIREQQRRRVISRRNLRRLLGDDSSGLIGRRVRMDEYLPDVLGSGGDSFKGLVTVQGMGGSMEPFSGTPTEGMFGGEIFDAQQILRQLAVRPNPIPLPEPVEPDEATREDDAERNALLRQLLQESQQRYAVSQAQYRTLEGFRLQGFGFDLPAYGGSFATGGVVPGAVGEARTIIAHGGERILSVAEQRNGTAGVLEVRITDQRTIVTGPNGQEVRAIVRDETRRQARGAMMRTPGGAR